MNQHVSTLGLSHLAGQIDNRAREDLFAFTWQVFSILHAGSGVSFVPNWHVQAICHELTCISRGENRRLSINVPPRHLKTICVCVAFSAWMLGKNPGLKIMSASYGGDLAEKSLRDLVTVMNSSWYRRLFPKTQIRGGTAEELRTTAGGGYNPVSVGGAVTGLGADIIIVDDILKASDATSGTRRKEANDFFEQTLSTRLNNKQTGVIVAIQQRLHEDDLSARLNEKGTYRRLILPAIAVEDQRVAIGDGRFHQRRQGDILFPQREPRSTLDQLRIDLGNAAFSAQFQQDPTPPDGNRMSWSVWKSYDYQFERPDAFQLVVQSWDTGMSAEPTSDYSACTTWGYLEGKWYLLEVFRQRMDYSLLKHTVLRKMRRWGAAQVIIEREGTGLILIRELVREVGVGAKLSGYKPRVDKEVRFNTQMARLEAGNFHLPTEAEWLAEYRHEMLAFPNGRHDDMVDSTSQFLDWLGNRRGLGSVNGPRSSR